MSKALAQVVDEAVEMHANSIQFEPQSVAFNTWIWNSTSSPVAVHALTVHGPAQSTCTFSQGSLSLNAGVSGMWP